MESYKYASFHSTVQSIIFSICMMEMNCTRPGKVAERLEENHECLFNKCLLSFYFVAGTLLDTEDQIKTKQTLSWPWWAYVLIREGSPISSLPTVRHFPKTMKYFPTEDPIEGWCRIHPFIQSNASFLPSFLPLSLPSFFYSFKHHILPSIHYVLGPGMDGGKRERWDQQRPHPPLWMKLPVQNGEQTFSWASVIKQQQCNHSNHPYPHLWLSWEQLTTYEGCSVSVHQTNSGWVGFTRSRREGVFDAWAAPWLAMTIGQAVTSPTALWLWPQTGLWWGPWWVESDIGNAERFFGQTLSSPAKSCSLADPLCVCDLGATVAYQLT